MPLLLSVVLLSLLALGPHGARMLAADARVMARPGPGRHRRAPRHAASAARRGRGR